MYSPRGDSRAAVVKLLLSLGISLALIRNFWPSSHKDWWLKLDVTLADVNLDQVRVRALNGFIVGQADWIAANIYVEHSCNELGCFKNTWTVSRFIVAWELLFSAKQICAVLLNCQALVWIIANAQTLMLALVSMAHRSIVNLLSGFPPRQ